MPLFGQVVIGSPGSGKTTYCNGLQQFFNSIGRSCAVINLDLANDRFSYECALDIRDYITLEEVMEEHSLGPNGGLIEAFETFSGSRIGAGAGGDAEAGQNSVLDTFVKHVAETAKRTKGYLIFDTPGQSELFTANFSLPSMFSELTRQLDCRLCCVNLVDSICLTQPSLYISALLMSLRSMLLLQMPHINVMSKIDLLSSYGELPFPLKFYLEPDNLSDLVPYLEKEIEGTKNKLGAKNLSKITRALIELVDDYHMVDYEVLCVEDTRSMMNLLRRCDKSNGYAFGTSEISGDSTWLTGIRLSSGDSNLSDFWGEEIDLQERWIDCKDEYDQRVREEQKAAMELLKKREQELQRTSGVNYGETGAEMPESSLGDGDEDEYERDLAAWMATHRN